MKKKYSLTTVLVLILFAVLLTFQITYNVVENDYQKKVDVLTKTQSDFSLLAYADGLIREYFKGSVDENSLETGLIKGYVSSLSDPYSRYLTPDEYKNYQKEKKKSGSGIGARFTYNTATEEVLVYAVYPDSPASKSGLRKGDVLYQIDGSDVSDLGFYESVKRLSGDSGTGVTVKVKRRLAAQILDMEFSMTRQEVKEPTVTYEMLSEVVACVQIFDITEDTDEEFSAVLDALTVSGVKGVVFDVRNNTGDNMDSVCNMLDLLLPKGVLMKKTDQKGNETKVKSRDGEVNFSMAVVMNSATACAPELFAATLRDFGKATLVGETTYGKGTLQTVVEMDNGAALILSAETFSPPNSPSFEGVGVIPDVESKTKSVNPYLSSLGDDSQIQDARTALGM